MFNRRRNSNSTRPSSSNPPIEESNPPTETTIRKKDKENPKWPYEREKLLLQLFDEAVAMNNYMFKNPNAAGKAYMVEKFNHAFNMNIDYKFFKNKLDEFKKEYKRWKELMAASGVTTDPITSTINASPQWWKDHETGCKITKKFKRKPPEFWDVMKRCFVLHDVRSQSQYSVRQRSKQLNNERLNDEDVDDDSDTDSDDMDRTRENEEVYRVVGDDNTRPSNEFTNEPGRMSNSSGQPY